MAAQESEMDKEGAKASTAMEAVRQNELKAAEGQLKILENQVKWSIQMHRPKVLQSLVTKLDAMGKLVKKKPTKGDLEQVQEQDPRSKMQQALDSRWKKAAAEKKGQREMEEAFQSMGLTKINGRFLEYKDITVPTQVIILSTFEPGMLSAANLKDAMNKKSTQQKMELGMRLVTCGTGAQPGEEFHTAFRCLEEALIDLVKLYFQHGCPLSKIQLHSLNWETNGLRIILTESTAEPKLRVQQRCTPQVVEYEWDDLPNFVELDDLFIGTNWNKLLAFIGSKADEHNKKV
jgi:hypothetical protein